MNKHKHLEFIQAVIARLSEHSFRLKTFSLIQGAIAMSADRGNVLAAVRSPSLSLFYLTLAATSLLVVLGGLGGVTESAGAQGS